MALTSSPLEPVQNRDCGGGCGGEWGREACVAGVYAESIIILFSASSIVPPSMCLNQSVVVESFCRMENEAIFLTHGYPFPHQLQLSFLNTDSANS